MRIGSLIIYVLSGMLLCATNTPGQTIPDPLPIDPGSLIGVPDPERPAPSPGGYIPMADPAEEDIPMAEPDTPDQARPSSLIPPLPPASGNLVPREQTQVSVLGYHEFSDIKPPTEMRIRTSTFKQQMTAIKNAGIPVISLDQFIEWKKGERQLPAFCIMITIDDGWKSVYTDAFPILKEMNFPFTLYLYTNFLTGRGASLSLGQVREMLFNGGSVGSHSTRHLYPADWKRSRRKGPQDYRQTIEREIRDSRLWLESNLPTKITTYCYPGGYHTPEMIEALPEFGYVGAFTVIPKKIYHDTNDWELPRYMVLGNNPPTFNRAVIPDKAKTTSASGTMNNVPEKGTDAPYIPSLPAPLQNVSPHANTVTTNSLPPISIELPNAQQIIPGSIDMKVSGFGSVPVSQIPETVFFQWIPGRPLRSGVFRVKVSWKSLPGNKPDSAEWEFFVKEDSTHTIPEYIVK